MLRQRRAKRIEAAIGALYPLPARPDRPAGRWVRADGCTEAFVNDPAGPPPDKRFPGTPLVVGGEIDPLARELAWARGLRFVPTGAADGEDATTDDPNGRERKARCDGRPTPSDPGRFVSLRQGGAARTAGLTGRLRPNRA